MKNYLICYDLHLPNQDYSALISTIKTAPYYTQINRSVWFVKSDLTAAQITQILEAVVDPNDVIFVADMQNCSWSKSLPIETQSFLNQVWSI